MAFFEIAFCLLICSFELTLGQRKLNKNLVLGADVKTGLNFDCPEEFGYYPHPDDCTQYYVCVFGGALLESCTGGLMYSHELQTCDWPRNVGCDGLEVVSATSSSTTSATSTSRQREEYRARFTPPPPPKPTAIVTSRGQPRPLHHTTQEIIKQQQQLYQDSEESLGPAEEVESDRQQRVYRGQPSGNIGQRDRDRDNIRHSSNAIQYNNGRGEKIGVISFGIHQQLPQYRVEHTSAAPVQTEAISVASRPIYNTTHYKNSFEPYYSVYDEDVEIYKDVEYSQQNSNNNNNNYNSGNQQNNSPSYIKAPSTSPQTSYTEDLDTTKRGNIAFIQTNYSPQDIYQQPNVADYNENNNFHNQEDDQTAYRQSGRQSSRNISKDGKENHTHQHTSLYSDFDKNLSTRKLPQPIHLHNNTLDDSGAFAPTNTILNNTENSIKDSIADVSLIHHNRIAIVNKPSPFTLPSNIRTTSSKINSFLKLSTKSTRNVSSQINSTEINRQHIKPTTYAPPKFYLDSILPRLPGPITEKILQDKSRDTTINIVSRNDNLKDNLNSFKTRFTNTDSQTSKQNTESILPYLKLHKNLKIISRFLSPYVINRELSTDATTSKFIWTKNNVSVESLNLSKLGNIETTTPFFVPTTSTVTKYENKSVDQIEDHLFAEKLRHYVARQNETKSDKKRFRTTVEIPPVEVLLSQEVQKQEPDQPPTYKLKPVSTTTDFSTSKNLNNRISRVNTAIKSMIASGGLRTQNIECNESNCSDFKQRGNVRGRGNNYHVANNPSTNEVSYTVNRGTAPPRSRPTLKPSTSIVFKATEFIDVYKYPPRRPDPIYPQPQPDKTAAKCRKDVCLLPDCNCGGKEIPGDLSPEQAPQIVLLTFDDSVNDLNKGLYSDLFEKGRVNPNGCPISATFYVSHEWTDYSQVQNLYSDGHEIASHTVSHSFGEQFSQKKWTREVAGQREILAAYGGVHLEDVRGMRAPFLSVGGNKMFKMLYDSNFTYDSSMPIYENKPPSWPYTLDYKLFHDCMIPPCPTRSYPGVWEVPMVMWQDLNGGRCSMGDACSNPQDAEGVFKMIMKNFQRHYTTNRAPFGLFYHAAWFTQPHHKEGFIQFLDTIISTPDVWVLTNWQAVQWVRDPTPINRLGSFQPFQCNYGDRPKRCNNPKVCNLWHKSGVRYMRTCQPCPDIYPWTGNTGIRSSKIDNDIED